MTRATILKTHEFYRSQKFRPVNQYVLPPHKVHFNSSFFEDGSVDGAGGTGGKEGGGGSSENEGGGGGEGGDKEAVEKKEVSPQ